MILPVVLLLKSSNWVSRIRNRNFSEKKYLVRYLSLLTFSSSRGVGGEGRGALDCPHMYFVSSVNVTINYISLAVIIAEMTFKL